MKLSLQHALSFNPPLSTLDTGHVTNGGVSASMVRWRFPNRSPVYRYQGVGAIDIVHTTPCVVF